MDNRYSVFVALGVAAVCIAAILFLSLVAPEQEAPEDTTLSGASLFSSGTITGNGHITATARYTHSMCFRAIPRNGMSFTKSPATIQLSISR